MTAEQDWQAISTLVARFDDAVNRGDVAEFSQLWTDDAVWEILDPFPLRREGAAAITETWQQMIAAMQWMLRGSFTGVLEITGDTATGRWPCIETGVRADGTGYDNRAIYEDSYLRRQDGWRFQSRTYRYLWLDEDDIPGRAIPFDLDAAETAVGRDDA